MSIVDKFIGTWKLVTTEYHRSDGTIIDPYGRGALGILMYDTAGNMAAQLMRSDRPIFVAGDMHEGTPDEIKAAFEGLITYFGRYDVNAETEIVTHHITGCSFPNWVGSDQTRFFAFSGDRLTLSTPPILLGGSTLTGVLVWERVA